MTHIRRKIQKREREKAIAKSVAQRLERKGSSQEIFTVYEGLGPFNAGMLFLTNGCPIKSYKRITKVQFHPKKAHDLALEVKEKYGVRAHYRIHELIEEALRKNYPKSEFLEVKGLDDFLKKFLEPFRLTHGWRRRIDTLDQYYYGILPIGSPKPESGANLCLWQHKEPLYSPKPYEKTD